MMGQHLRKEVLSLFKSILKVARSWEAKSGNLADAVQERDYIKNEAKVLFRKNKLVDNEEEIKRLLNEAAARLTIALHYHNPYPRPANVPPKTFIKSITTGSSVENKW
ncbi:LYR motif containing protein 1 [Chamberlinius hualienensis]